MERGRLALLAALCRIFSARLRRRYAIGLAPDMALLLDRQDRIELQSYDSSIGRQAVWAAGSVLEDVFISQPRKARLSRVIQSLEELQKRQNAVKGEYSTGGSTVGSILSEVRRWPR